MHEVSICGTLHHTDVDPFHGPVTIHSQTGEKVHTSIPQPVCVVNFRSCIDPFTTLMETAGQSEKGMVSAA
jgi:hypothetical protein